MNMVNVLLAGLSVMLVLVSLPLLLRRIPPNAFYGLRVPATYADEWVWYEANALTGRDMVALGVLLTVLALALPVLRLEGGTPTLVWAAVAAVGSLVMTMVGWSRANRLLRQRRRDAPQP
jgi:uncharacterized membrane protein